MVTEEPPPKLPRDRHLFGPGPKRILALDGGGVRGAITVAFLERIEKLLAEYHGKDARLCDWFDLVGGTSTGSIIAGALALGYRAEQVRDFYLRLAPNAFERALWHVPYIQSKFRSHGLRGEIEKVVGDRTLDSSDLITGLGIFAKRMDTGSPWILSNNPRAPYWDDKPDHIGNRHYKLATLVRASTAAPHFFEPEILEIITEAEIMRIARGNQPTSEQAGQPRGATVDSSTHGIFVDGGMSPHGNPALGLFQMTQFKPFGICWPTGTDRLTVVSVGTGTYRPRLSFEKLILARFLRLGFKALLSLMHDAEQLVLAQMQWMGDTLTPWIINSEIGALPDDAPPGGKYFRFLRYDVRLERNWLESKLGIKRTQHEVERLRPMDRPSIVHDLYEIAKVAAEQQVKEEHWKALLSPSANDESFARMRSEPL